MLCDNLNLPFRDESLDAVLSVAVIHHVATAERRVRALRELARVVRVGGRVMISVWAMEQRHRKVIKGHSNNMWHFSEPLCDIFFSYCFSDFYSLIWEMNNLESIFKGLILISNKTFKTFLFQKDLKQYFKKKFTLPTQLPWCHIFFEWPFHFSRVPGY